MLSTVFSVPHSSRCFWYSTGVPFVQPFAVPRFFIVLPFALLCLVCFLLYKLYRHCQGRSWRIPEYSGILFNPLLAIEFHESFQNGEWGGDFQDDEKHCVTLVLLFLIPPLYNCYRHCQRQSLINPEFYQKSIFVNFQDYHILLLTRNHFYGTMDMDP